MGEKMQIHGKKILGFPYGDVEIVQQLCDFYIVEGSHEFIIEINDYPIEKALDLLYENESVYRNYLFCIDENGEAFTLYDCYIMPMQIPVKQMKIIWNKCVLGCHIEDIQSEKINSAEYIVQTDSQRYPFHMFVGRNYFDVLNSTVHISTDWHQEKDKFGGVSICISLEESVAITVVEKIILRLLEIYFLQIGFFPKVESRKMISENQKIYYFLEDFAAYGKTAKKNIKLDSALDTKDNLNFSVIYDKWWKLREKEVVTFNLFSYLTTESSPVREVPIATCIQCFEGYFRIHHTEEMLRFSKTAKKQIKKEVSELLDSSENLKRICEENGIEFKDIKESFSLMSGHINEYSLKDILQYAIKRYDATKRLFEYERVSKINDEVTILDLFIQKASGHRNWLSHLTEQRKRFIGKEIDLADKKLRLLFRLTLLYDIGNEVTDISLDSLIKKIDKWYESNILK